jgi:hypothetical protein
VALKQWGRENSMGRYLCSTLLESSSCTSCLTILSVTLQKRAFGDKQRELKGGAPYSVRALLMRALMRGEWSRAAFFVPVAIF